MYHYVNERIGRSPRHSLKDAKETRHKNVPLGSCLQPLSFSSFLLQLICFVIELCFQVANVDIFHESTKLLSIFLQNTMK